MSSMVVSRRLHTYLQFGRLFFTFDAIESWNPVLFELDLPNNQNCKILDALNIRGAVLPFLKKTATLM